VLLWLKIEILVFALPAANETLSPEDRLLLFLQIGLVAFTLLVTTVGPLQDLIWSQAHHLQVSRGLRIAGVLFVVAFQLFVGWFALAKVFSTYHLEPPLLRALQDGGFPLLAFPMWPCIYGLRFINELRNWLRKGAFDSTSTPAGLQVMSFAFAAGTTLSFMLTELLCHQLSWEFLVPKPHYYINIILFSWSTTLVVTAAVAHYHVSKYALSDLQESLV